MTIRRTVFTFIQTWWRCNRLSTQSLTHFTIKDQLEVRPPLQLIVQILSILQAFVDLSFKPFWALRAEYMLILLYCFVFGVFMEILASTLELFLPPTRQYGLLFSSRWPSRGWSSPDVFPGSVAPPTYLLSWSTATLKHLLLLQQPLWWPSCLSSSDAQHVVGPAEGWVLCELSASHLYEMTSSSPPVGADNPPWTISA